MAPHNLEDTLNLMTLILVGNNFVLVGFREVEWAAALGIRTNA